MPLSTHLLRPSFFSLDSASVRSTGGEVITFPFRPWIRRSCAKAMIWGIGVVGALGLVAWVFRDPGSAPISRAFGVLAAYGMLFWLTLLKVWWTGGDAAVVLDDEKLAYQPLHTFRRKAIPWNRVLFCGPRSGTQSLRLVHENEGGVGRDFFLNLGVIDGRNEFLDAVAQKLEANGLVAVAGQRHTWQRQDWDVDS